MAMNNSLKTKLINIIATKIKQCEADLDYKLNEEQWAEKAMPLIEQALKDEDYYRIEDFKVDGMPAVPMTGAEWYEEFQRYIEHSSPLKGVDKVWALEAAKKASGLQ
jgi:hypothetical protein